MLDYEPSVEISELRARLRDLIATDLPPDFLGAFTSDPADLERAQGFCRRLADDQLLCLAWPEEYGGLGASIWEQTAVREEMWAFHEPRGAQYMGVNWVGPALMRHGTDDQRSRHLPPIAEGRAIWCQGFSEPDAGSDLASLQTSAVRDGEGWSITGQKIWTSYATMADQCFLLARTHRGDVKQQGITVFLAPMDAEGVEVRPIDTMLGPHHLNEVFFDGLWVPDADVLGPVGGGWDIVMDVLSFERVGIARYARAERLLRLAPGALASSWHDLPDGVRSGWARCLVQCRQARLLAYRVVATQATGQVKPSDAAAYRIAVTRLDQDSARILMEIVDQAALDDDSGQRFRAAVEDHWRYSVSATVSSGSIEMQRILMSRELLRPHAP